MYENSGSKIKGVAIIFCIVNVILGIVAAIGIFETSDSGFVSFVVFCVFAAVGWLSYLLLAGFGELVENSAIIASAIHPASNPTPAPILEEDTSGQAPKHCPFCGSELSAGLCPQCNMSFADSEIKTDPPALRFCPKCGSPWKSGVSFCSKCGYDPQ